MTNSAPFEIPTGQRQLFLDDHGIATIGDLTRTMHQPAKKGAVIRPNTEIGEISLQTRSVPAWDPEAGVFKLWMITSGPWSGMTYAESKDGIHWTKPILRQKEFDGSLENNIMTMDPTLEWPGNALMIVVYDPDDKDPSRRFKGFAHCYNREPVVSPDGIHWTNLDVPTIPSKDESNLSYDPLTRIFIATLKENGPNGRSHGIWTSKNFENWTRLDNIFHADDLDQKLGLKHIKARFADPMLQQPVADEPSRYNVDVYNMGVFRYESLYIGTPALFHSTGPSEDGTNTDGFHLVQLICSRDLQNWKRLGDRQTFIGPSKLDSGAYDLTQILGPSNAIVRGDELLFYYTGIKYRSRPANPDIDAGAICLAVLRRDGFISLDAGEQPGTLSTQPFELSGTKLVVNLDATEGSLTVEALDDAGSVVAASAELTGDLPQGEVAWTAGSLAELQGKHVRLRFTLRNGSLYSYWIEE